MPNSGSRLAAWLGLFGRGVSWLAVAGFFVTFTAGAYATAAILDRASETGAVSVGWTLTALSLVQLAVWALLLSFLARRLGGGEARTAIGALLLAWVVYYIVGIVPAAFLQGLVIGQVQDRPDLVPSFNTAISLFWSVAVFPLPVWLVAAAHGGGKIGLGTIWAYLVERGTGLWLLFVAFQLVSLGFGLGLDRLLGDEVETNGDALLRQAFEALRATAIVLFYVMAYREIRASVSPSDSAFS